MADALGCWEWWLGSLMAGPAEEAARRRSALLCLWCLLTHPSAPEMEYAWYWLDDSGQWIEYGEQHPDHCSATVTSAVLEKEFLADRKGIVLFRAGSQKYALSFEDMAQTNLRYGTHRTVARLPKFLYSECGKDRRQNITLSHFVCPPEWDKSALPDIGFKLVKLSDTSCEYGKIKTLFEKTMKDCCIHQLQRIQNPTLWQVFQWQKEQMKKLNKSKSVDERLLFHGTNPSHVSAICEQNFDWRICGTHGTTYGKEQGASPTTSADVELCFQTHQCTFEFQVGSQKYETDFEARALPSRKKPHKLLWPLPWGRGTEKEKETVQRNLNPQTVIKNLQKSQHCSKWQ
ncbi:protein mono-ADP-ribosyltransferase PARP12-like isoform X3 [Caloenas nicobarica]|uniref:protein mono-ADP-ribosyltransferase PARP12-like isoform X3 n=1 Tax=Caloenas nicobarica TaxID=187106 RepID=UPI0032B81F56